MELVKVRNTHPDTPLKLVHDELGDVTIPSGEEVILQFAYVMVSFGDPAIRNVGINKTRDIRYSQVLTNWGMFRGINENEWDDIAPRFEVHTMDGKRIWTILEDPDGTEGPLNAPSAQDTSTNTMQNEIATLQSQIDKLNRITAASQALDPPVPESSELPAEPVITPNVATTPTETQTVRNEARDDIPVPQKKAVAKDGPRSRAKV